jgi:hypothetical protein
MANAWSLRDYRTAVKNAPVGFDRKPGKVSTLHLDRSYLASLWRGFLIFAR